ncbi:hypothetical protein [Planococcus lenghuensis]|uniref:Uncharacterized protein n=1 Tax=Planococcus lenghuensis TaxID=2213202 RepID=A0A1Q2L339_9BACL|nr:hypothetical protein [Planococcus lenghuensis]AQQ54784.1 hypothetical protein B0X71_17860 [Planococcus lenghuensis]
MRQNQPVTIAAPNYWFTKVKDTHIEEGQLFITLFARLAVHTAQGVQNVWAEIDEVKWEHASRQLQRMPRGEYTYRISAEVFAEMEWLTGLCHEELYFLTPLYEANRFRPFG